MTEKLYYKDAYLSEFTAKVISVNSAEQGYDVVLDRTAFFPEEGGQSADLGYIDQCRVLDVRETDGIVHHYTDSAPSRTEVSCKLDFADRFEKMQCHTAEHILCGIIHRRYGLENVGFHLGDDVVTFDISAPLGREELDSVEDEANEAVFANLPVEAFFPTSEQLPTLTYRSKLDLTEGVRIVKIGDVDSCACCAPHVSRTGEIGLIKILDFMKHRGGLRIFMAAGRKALADYRGKYENIRAISAMLSAPQSDTAAVLADYMRETEAIKYRLSQARKSLAALYGESVPSTDGNLVKLVPDFGFDELRELANTARNAVAGIFVALSGEDGNYKYVITSDTSDVQEAVKRANAALCGKGGGRANMAQGSFSCDIESILKFFS